jgi:phosphatidylinositol alpha-1,6-mannosyltransferase
LAIDDDDTTLPMTIRIVALVGDCYGAPGGIARYNQDLFESLVTADQQGSNAQEQQAEILVVPRLGDASAIALPAHIRQWPPVFSRLLYSLVAFWVAWHHRPIDVVFCGHVFMAPLAWGLARFFGARYWLQTHGVDIWTPQRGLKRTAVEKADLVTAVSRVTRRRLLGWAHLDPYRVRVLPNTVRDVFAPGVASPAYRERIGLRGAPVLLTVGRLASTERSKGHEPIFAILPALRVRFPNLVYVIAGDGDDRERLEARARQLGLGQETVRFLGYVPDEELPDLYRLADLFVMPSATEGFGIVYLEAAACGLRVLGGAGDGSNDAIQDARVGATVDPDDLDALLSAIETGLSNGRVDPAAIEAYRRPHFARVARLVLTELMEAPVGRQLP